MNIIMWYLIIGLIVGLVLGAGVLYLYAKKKTDDALSGLMSSIETIGEEHVLKSESGLFYTDGNGIVQRFEPAGVNPFFDEDIEKTDNYTYKTQKSIRSLVIPNGVRGFSSDFMRGVRVTERFELPEGLISIGNNSFDMANAVNCVFADCILPAVVIPESVKEIGIFAFGHTHIESLQLPLGLQSPYGRQFKDSYIGTLRLSHEWKVLVSLGKNNRLYRSGILNSDDFGYLEWPSTHVEKLVFYQA